MKKAKKEKTAKASTWYEQVFETLDFYDSKEHAGVDIESEPAWVMTVLRELVQQSMPIVEVRRPKRATPRAVGRLLGQMRGNIYAIGEALVRKPLVDRDARFKIYAANRHVLGVQSAIDATAFLDRSVKTLKADRERLEKTAVEAFKVALSQPSREEAAEFFQGFSEGVSKPGMTGDSKFAGATTATTIYLRLFMDREHIKKLKSVLQLREFLLQRGLTDQLLGDPRRLEKICERIGFHPGRAGRKRAK